MSKQSKTTLADTVAKLRALEEDIKDLTAMYESLAKVLSKVHRDLVGLEADYRGFKILTRGQ